jgi:hypothetical protein
MRAAITGSIRRRASWALVLACLAVAGCGSGSSTSSSATASSAPASTSTAATSTAATSAPAASSSASGSGGIPQGPTAGDRDSDNNGGPSDGDGNL